jgi:peptidoglycan biosynthesis protein MviN/MurJ (putative lipid II flippase)
MSEEKSKTPMIAGGVFIAIGMLLGAVFGIYIGQPSAGMVMGLVMGISAAILVWLFDRARRS